MSQNEFRINGSMIGLPLEPGASREPTPAKLTDQYEHLWDLPNEEEYQMDMLFCIKDCITFLVCETGLDYDDFLVDVEEPKIEESADGPITCMGNFAIMAKMIGTEAKREDHYPYKGMELAMLIHGFHSGWYRNPERVNRNTVTWNNHEYMWVREGQHFFYKQIK